jgi:hypothetical protein
LPPIECAEVAFPFVERNLFVVTNTNFVIDGPKTRETSLMCLALSLSWANPLIPCTMHCQFERPSSTTCVFNNEISCPQMFIQYLAIVRNEIFCFGFDSAVIVIDFVPWLCCLWSFLQQSCARKGLYTVCSPCKQAILGVSTNCK